MYIWWSLLTVKLWLLLLLLFTGIVCSIFFILIFLYCKIVLFTVCRFSVYLMAFDYQELKGLLTYLLICVVTDDVTICDVTICDVIITICDVIIDVTDDVTVVTSLMTSLFVPSLMTSLFVTSLMLSLFVTSLSTSRHYRRHWCRHCCDATIDVTVDVTIVASLLCSTPATPTHM